MRMRMRTRTSYETRKKRGAGVSTVLQYVLFYESGDLTLAAENFPAHEARYTESCTAAS